MSVSESWYDKKRLSSETCSGDTKAHKSPIKIGLRHKKQFPLGYAPLFERVVYPGGKLPKEHPFSFDSAIKDRYAMPTESLRAYRTINYHRLCTGGFNRVCTERCRVYWLAQNAHGHTTPDWKIHFSIKKDLKNLGLAWDILCAVFLDHACEFGIKVTVAEALGDGKWPDTQRGREITLYVFKHSEKYDSAAPAEAAGEGIGGAIGGPMADLAPPSEVHNFWLSKEYERSGRWCSVFFWRNLIREAERRLRHYKIESAGCADGDLPLGRFASIRNEAFVPWHPAGEETKVPRQQQKRRRKMKETETSKDKKEIGNHNDVVKTRKNVNDSDNCPHNDSSSLKDTTSTRHRLIYPPNPSGWNAAGHSIHDILSDSWRDSRA